MGAWLKPVCWSALKDGKATGLPHPLSGGWRKALQDKLRAAGIAYDFVGELSYAAFGRDGIVDSAFDPDHHGLAGFSNAGMLKGGMVPTPPDVLAALSVKQIKVPGIVDVLKKHQPATYSSAPSAKPAPRISSSPPSSRRKPRAPASTKWTPTTPRSPPSSPH